MKRKPGSMRGLEELGRVRLSKSFFLRDFLHSEIANFHGLQNIPDDPDLAIEVGTRLCEKILEPLQDRFGRVAIRSGYRSPEVNDLGNKKYGCCARNEDNFGAHIWDRRGTDGRLGATACVVVPWFADRFRAEGDWRQLAWRIHDYLPYSTMYFHPKLWAFNIGWHERPARTIASYLKPKGILTKPGMANHAGCHQAEYQGLLRALQG